MYLIQLAVVQDTLFNNMKKIVNIVKKSRNIFLICFLILLLTFFFIKKSIINNQNFMNKEKNTIIDADNNINKEYFVEFKKIDLNDKLKNYLDNGYEVSIDYIENNTIYGDIHDTASDGELFITKYLFSYNCKSKKFEIIKYNGNLRILNYYFFKNAFYVSIIHKDNNNPLGYQWTIAKYDKNLKEYIILKKGIVLEPINSPNFYYDKNNDNLYSVAINDDYEENNGEIIKRLQTMTTYAIKEEQVLELNKKSGDYINKTGEMLCSIFNIQIDKSELLYCITDYLDKQSIVSFNLTENKEKLLYENSLNEKLIINNFQKKDNILYIGLYNIENMQSGKTIYYDFSNDEKTVIDSEVFYGKYVFIGNKLLFHNLEKWKIYDNQEKTFYSVSVDTDFSNKYIYPTFYIINYKNILVKSNDNTFYIGKLIVK